jgi:DNA mismatch repair protein MutS
MNSIQQTAFGKMSLYNEYEAYALKYINEYGKDTVVLYRCGSFFEIYSIDDGLIDIKKLSELLNIQMSKRNKSIPEVSRNNCLMAGFPAYTLQKFVNILVNENYTVVIVDQITDPPKPQRAVTAIVSPGTDLTNLSAPDANNLMTIYFEENIEYRTKSKLLSIGISVIDVSTGCCKVFETSSKMNDYSYAMDEAYRIINIENPREIVLFGKRVDGCLALLELDGRCVHDMFDKKCEDIYNITYQAKLLQKIYPKHGLLSVIEFLDLEKSPIATISFVFLLEFVFKHNEQVLTKINKPTFIECSANLILSYNAVKHLNILCSDNKQHSLLHMLNKCVTAIGKRKFRDSFLNPIVDQNILNARYDQIELYRQDGLYCEIRKHLNNVYDLERLHRRVQLKLLHPCEIVQIACSLDGLLEIYNITQQYDCRKVQEFKTFLNDNVIIQDAEKFNQDTMDKNIFNTAHPTYVHAVTYQQQVDDLKSYFEQLILSLNSFVNGEFFKVDNNQVDGYHLVITMKRYNDFKQRLKKFTFAKGNMPFTFEDVIIKPTASKTCYKISHPCFSTLGQLIDSASAKLISTLKELYMLFLETMDACYADVFQDMIRVIGEIDYYSTCAKLSIENNYVRPSIVEHGKAYVDAKDLRHPIIEKLTPTGYVPNDVAIGKDITGILLYGTNMVGKSAYMKSIGLSIIMAQCGMYVPAKHFEYSPYHKIFTRIPSGDDLFKGQSTFAVEVSELRNILKRADEHSLVIGDELASGTESISAVAIVGSGINALYSKKSSFVFATHLHDLTSLSCIKSMNKMKIYHMSVIYDDDTKKLIYNRKLQEGQGNTLYGLEVCRAMDMGSTFLTIANDIRRELMEQHKTIIGTKKSTYNASHYVDVCSVCGKTATEVHHIKHQSQTDGNGFIGHVHKNALHNLMNVCEECHDNIHANKIHVEGYIQTSEGIELQVNSSKNVSDGNDKENENLEQKIVRMRQQERLSLQKIKAELAKENINITVYKIQQMLKS